LSSTINPTNIEKSDEQICEIEIKEYNRIFAKKDDLVRNAAIKLDDSGKYKEELYKISAVIAKLFPKFSSSTISIALEEKYKRKYTKLIEDEDEPDTPLSQLEEFLFILEDNFKSFNNSIKQIIKAARKDPDARDRLEESFSNSIHKFHKNLSHYMMQLTNELFEIKDITSMIEYTKQLGIDIKLLENQTDPRTLFDALTKFSLKMQFTKQNFNNLGIQFKENIELRGKFKPVEADYNDLLSTLDDCPRCNFDFKNYVVQQKLAHDKGKKLTKAQINKLIDE